MDWIDITNSEHELAACDECGMGPAVQVHQGKGIYRVACECQSVEGNTLPEAVDAWEHMAEEGPELPEPIPPSACAPEHFIRLRLGLTGEGQLYLYDAVTGRPVAYQREVAIRVVDPADDIQAAVIDVYTDGRLVDPEAKKAIKKRMARRRNEVEA